MIELHILRKCTHPIEYDVITLDDGQPTPLSIISKDKKYYVKFSSDYLSHIGHTLLHTALGEATDYYNNNLE